MQENSEICWQGEPHAIQITDCSLPQRGNCCSACVGRTRSSWTRVQRFHTHRRLSRLSCALEQRALRGAVRGACIRWRHRTFFTDVRRDHVRKLEAADTGALARHPPGQAGRNDAIRDGDLRGKKLLDESAWPDNAVLPANWRCHESSETRIRLKSRSCLSSLPKCAASCCGIAGSTILPGHRWLREVVAKISKEEGVPDIGLARSVSE
jgi:hypothetical protein